jgi:2-haloacid dehalogenase
MPIKIHGVRACVFDAYGTLFDVNSAAHTCQDSLGEQWLPLAELWRSKQLQYTWLRGLTGNHADFWQVTGDALDFALATLQLNDPALRLRLMDLYLTLNAYPDVVDTLKRLKAAAMKLAILSVEEVKVYKPHPSVYGLVCSRLNVAPSEVCFLSSNGWDAYSAKAFGFRVLWCNRLGQAPERIPETPDAQIATLADLPDIVLASD